MYEQWQDIGSFQKATMAKDGTPHVLFHVNGPKQDSQGERMTEEGRDIFVKAGKEGRIDLVPSHTVPIALGKSADAMVDTAGELFVDFALDKDDPWALKLHKGVLDGTFKGQCSAGGRCKRDHVAKTFTPIDDPKVPFHVALTMADAASYEDAGPVAAFVKGIVEKNLDGVEWTEAKTAKAVEVFAKGAEIYDSQAALQAIMNMTDALSSLKWLYSSESMENEPEAAGQIASLKAACIALDEALMNAKEFIASEILEGKDGEIQVGEGDNAFMLSRKDGKPVVEWVSFAKKKFSAEKRKALAKEGKALPDGSFPIEDVSDLENAIKAYGRASDKEAAKKHIEKRAKELGATDKLPEDWTKSKVTPSAPVVSPVVTPVVESFEKSEAFLTMQKSITTLTESLAKANETLSAWKPIVERVSAYPMPVAGKLKAVAVTKEADGEPMTKAEEETKPAHNGPPWVLASEWKL
jgi:hypothetical protein